MLTADRDDGSAEPDFHDIGISRGRKDSIFGGHELLKILWKHRGELLPCKQLKPAPKLKLTNCPHHSVPAFDQVRPASVTKDTKGASCDIRCKRTSNQLIAALLSIPQLQLWEMKNRLQITIA